MIMTGRYKVTGQFYTLQFLTVLLLHRKTGKAKKARNIREKITVREPILILLFEIGCRTIMAKDCCFNKTTGIVNSYLIMILSAISCIPISS